jgi:hypothetical protein
MDIGFTGSREGMTRAQADQLAFVLGMLHCPAAPPPKFHYGTHEDAALLADEEAAAIAGRLGFVLVPHYAQRGSELDRDRRQAAAVDIMLAAPRTNAEQQRSGTWATVRYARDLGKPVILLSTGRRR